MSHGHGYEERIESLESESVRIAKRLGQKGPKQKEKDGEAKKLASRRVEIAKMRLATFKERCRSNSFKRDVSILETERRDIQAQLAAVSHRIILAEACLNDRQTVQDELTTRVKQTEQYLLTFGTDAIKERLAKLAQAEKEISIQLAKEGITVEDLEIVYGKGGSQAKKTA